MQLTHAQVQKLKPYLPTKAPRSWAEYSYRTGYYLITTSFIVGLIPFTFDLNARIRIQKTTSQFHIWRCHLINGFIAGCDISIAGAILRDFLNGNLSPGGSQGIFMIFFVVAGVFLFFMQAHTLWKVDSIVGCINSCVLYYEDFQDEYSTGSKNDLMWEDVLCGGLKTIYIAGVSLACPAICGIFMFSCRLHIAHPLMAELMCTTDGHHQSFFWMPFWILLEFYVVIFHGLAIFFYVDVLLAIIIFGRYTVIETLVSEADARTKSNLRCTTSIDKSYRCAEVVGRLLNNAVGDVFMPIHLVLGMMFFITLVTGIIRFNDKLTPIGILGALACATIYIIYLNVFLEAGADLAEKYDGIIKLRYERNHGLYDEAMVKSYSIIRLKIGQFACLDKSTVVMVMLIIVDRVADLLLL